MMLVLPDFHDRCENILAQVIVTEQDVIDMLLNLFLCVLIFFSAVFVFVLKIFAVVCRAYAIHAVNPNRTKLYHHYEWLQISDHDGTYVSIDCGYCNRKTFQRTIWDYKRGDYLLMKNKITETDWENILS
jgi:hypothetical protein